MENLEAKFLGCIYGLAIGDAMGFPVEFFTLEQIRRIFGKEGITGFESFRQRKMLTPSKNPIGFYSDDTQMSIATARGLLGSKDDSVEEIMNNISTEYIAWSESPDMRAYGRTCIRGVINMKKGMHWKNSGIPEGDGCGTAMRVSPIGLYFYDDLKKLTEVSCAASACTHGHPTAIASGIITAYAISQVLNSTSPEKIFENVLRNSQNLEKGLGEKIFKVKEILEYENHFDALKELGLGWEAGEAVALALYCFMKNPNDYRKTILMGANTEGDSDSIASMAGAISGAYNGIKAIPQEWIEQIENRELLGEIATQLYKKSIRKR